ncbi:MAG: fumarylacetoacetate hydrolase family protein [Pseudomonadota bacterium]
MKLARYTTGNGMARIGVLDGDRLVELAGPPGAEHMATWLSPEGQQTAKAQTAGRTHRPLAGITWLPPLSAGCRVFCVGINYRTHAAETGRELNPFPSIHLRTHDSVVGHAQALRLPTVSSHYDYEGELAVLVGRAGRHIAPADALGHVAGYTCFNEGSVRDYQKHSVTAGKNFDASGSCGPWVVTADEVPDPTQLTLTTRLNGTEVQHTTTDLLIYPIADILAYISRFAALRPGDIVATGTPAGVGARHTPPLWMRTGDVVEVQISSIGMLRNTVE